MTIGENVLDTLAEISRVQKAIDAAPRSSASPLGFVFGNIRRAELYLQDGDIENCLRYITAAYSWYESSKTQTEINLNKGTPHGR